VFKATPRWRVTLLSTSLADPLIILLGDWLRRVSGAPEWKKQILKHRYRQSVEVSASQSPTLTQRPRVKIGREVTPTDTLARPIRTLDHCERGRLSSTSCWSEAHLINRRVRFRRACLPGLLQYSHILMKTTDRFDVFSTVDLPSRKCGDSPFHSKNGGPACLLADPPLRTEGTTRIRWLEAAECIQRKITGAFLPRRRSNQIGALL